GPVIGPGPLRGGRGLSLRSFFFAARRSSGSRGQCHPHAGGPARQAHWRGWRAGWAWLSVAAAGGQPPGNRPFPRSAGAVWGAAAAEPGTAPGAGGRTVDLLAVLGAHAGRRRCAYGVRPGGSAQVAGAGGAT